MHICRRVPWPGYWLLIIDYTHDMIHKKFRANIKRLPGLQARAYSTFVNFCFTNY